MSNQENVKNYRFLTPSNVKLIIESDIKIHYENKVVIIKPEEISNGDISAVIDLTEVRGIEYDEHRLVFRKHEAKNIVEYQKNGKWLQVFYYMLEFINDLDYAMDYKEGGLMRWVEVIECNEFSFYDTLYKDNEEELNDEW